MTARAPRESRSPLWGRDLGELLAAIYALELDEDGHLRAIQEAWGRLPIGGELTMAFAIRADAAEVVVLDQLHLNVPSLKEAFVQVLPSVSRAYRLGLLRAPPFFGAMSMAYGRTRAAQASRERGVHDFRCMHAPTGTGFAVTVGVPLLSDEPPPATSPLFAGLAHHLSASWRLRKRLAAADGFGESAEAIFTPGGRATEALGAARTPAVRDRLRELVRARERALRRGGGALWPALLDGRYTIIDRLESSGARYVVAYRNSRTAAQLVRLGARERMVVNAVTAGVAEKVIAVDLGVSPAWVSRALTSALRKLGLANAIELTLLASSSEFVVLDDEVLGRGIMRAFALAGSSADGLLQLTAAERAVASDLLRGLSSREIAARRNRSERTIANQVASILSKMGAPSRRALVAMLVR